MPENWKLSDLVEGRKKAILSNLQTPEVAETNEEACLTKQNVF